MRREDHTSRLPSAPPPVDTPALATLGSVMLAYGGELDLAHDKQGGLLLVASSGDVIWRMGAHAY